MIYRDWIVPRSGFESWVYFSAIPSSKALNEEDNETPIQCIIDWIPIFISSSHTGQGKTN